MIDLQCVLFHAVVNKALQLCFQREEYVIKENTSLHTNCLPIKYTIEPKITEEIRETVSIVHSRFFKSGHICKWKCYYNKNEVIKQKSNKIRRWNKIYFSNFNNTKYIIRNNLILFKNGLFKFMSYTKLSDILAVLQ